jgi:hypothetical protein
MSHEFLSSCESKPFTLKELKPGQRFIFFPCDGDDSGHGGFRGAERICTKITALPSMKKRNYCDSSGEKHMPDDALVIPVCE